MQKLKHIGNTPETKGGVIHWARYYDFVAWMLTLGKEYAIREMTIDMAGLAPGEKVLDVGCGTGTLTLAAKRRVGPAGEVYGIDPSPEMIDISHQKAMNNGLDIAFQTGVIEDISFPDNTFDVVISSLVMHHLPDDLKQKGIREIYRVLKPGGRFFCIDLEKPENLFYRIVGTLFLFHNLIKTNLEKCLAMMEQAGFQEIKMGRTEYKLLAYIQGEKIPTS